MKAEKSATYTSSQFTMNDLRQIVADNESVEGEADVDIDKNEPYRGEYGSTTYTITIG